ncbi:MAG: hypothetical protein CFH06_00392 [Alphaproteobacteria bacterium MarineAlpha3_Bin5]|nr:MAG: hypothetical protein CFH06_00392 [Alphaproteobacteria bacterium MarineAlpha3_Bin5]
MIRVWGLSLGPLLCLTVITKIPAITSALTAKRLDCLNAPVKSIIILANAGPTIWPTPKAAVIQARTGHKLPTVISRAKFNPKAVIPILAARATIPPNARFILPRP